MVEMLAAMHTAEEHYNSARFAKVRDEAKILQFSTALDAAKMRVDTARRNFEDHVREHQCKH
jgi:hypothetical protein